MASCNEMKKGEIYTCEKCGVELQVVKECGDQESCSTSSCAFTCCDEALKKKS